MFNIRAANSYLLFVEVPHPRAAPFYGGVISDCASQNKTVSILCMNAEAYKTF